LSFDTSFTATTADKRTARAVCRLRHDDDGYVRPDGELELMSTESLPQDVVAIRNVLAEMFFDGWLNRMAELEAEVDHLSRGN